MAHIISIVSSNGGAGKTTVALNLAVALTEGQEPALLIDLDPLGAIGFSLARGATKWPGLAEYLMDLAAIDDVLMPTKLGHLTLLPRGRLDPLDVGLYEQFIHGDGILQQILGAVEDRYRYIVIDTPSGLGQITRAALAASTHTLLPLQAEPLALRTISQTLRVIQHVRDQENPGLQLLGILANMVQLKQDVSFTIMNTVWSTLSGVLETYMPRSDIFAQASEKGLPVAFLSGKYSAEAIRFESLATEIKSIIHNLGGVAGEFNDRPQRALV